MKTLRNSTLDYLSHLLDVRLMPTAIRVAVVVGSVLFFINHGAAVFTDQMNQQRWFSAIFTYIVPYCVNIHGQWINNRRRRV